MTVWNHLTLHSKGQLVLPGEGHCQSPPGEGVESPHTPQQGPARTAGGGTLSVTTRGRCGITSHSTARASSYCRGRDTVSHHQGTVWNHLTLHSKGQLVLPGEGHSQSPPGDGVESPHTPQQGPARTAGGGTLSVTTRGRCGITPHSTARASSYCRGRDTVSHHQGRVWNHLTLLELEGTPRHSTGNCYEIFQCQQTVHLHVPGTCFPAKLAENAQQYRLPDVTAEPIYNYCNYAITVAAFPAKTLLHYYGTRLPVALRCKMLRSAVLAETNGTK